MSVTCKIIDTDIYMFLLSASHKPRTGMVPGDCRRHSVTPTDDVPGGGDVPEEHGTHEQQHAKDVRPAGEDL